jgi:DNA gyrase/topoisomerase IV subunit A
LKSPEELANELNEAAERAAAMLSELRSELKETRRVIKEAREVRETLVDQRVTEAIDLAVAEHVVAMGDKIDETKDELAKQLIQRFDRLTSLAIGGKSGGTESKALLALLDGRTRVEYGRGKPAGS